MVCEYGQDLATSRGGCDRGGGVKGTRNNPAVRSSAPPTTVWLVRHAEVNNPNQVLYGQLPRFHLSERGREQAESVAAFFADRPVAAIYTSPLLRARQTGRVIAQHHPEATMHRSLLLHEVGSAWQGTEFASLKPGFSTYEDRREPDDESIEDIQRRMTAFVERVRRRHPGQAVVAVSHGDPITILRLALSGRPVTHAAMRGPDYAGLCSITEVTFPPGGEPQVSYLTVPGLADPPGGSTEGRLQAADEETT